MGQGGYLWIVNATQKVLRRVHIHSYQMDDWNFGSTISANSSQRFYIEYSQGIFETWSDDAGEVVFELGDSGQQFEVRVRWISKGGLSVDWRNVDRSSYYMYPGEPGDIGELGWIHNGSLCMVIIEKGYQYSLPNSPSIDATKPGNDTPAVSAPSNWMEKYLDPIGKLTLLELTLPGTHDAGTYKPTALWPVSTYIKTQDISIRSQLDKGVRVLDLRIGQEQPGEYVICHDTYTTSYTLSSALTEVTDFIGATNKELVILDFHRFVNLGGGSYDYDQLKSQVASLLSGYCITYAEGNGQTLDHLLSLGQNKRIVVAWNSSNIDNSFMWPGLNQHWYESASSNSDLISEIKKDFESDESYLWGACVFTNPSRNFLTPYRNASYLFPEVDNWFFGCSELSSKANVILTDFFDSFNNFINASIIANLLKAAKK